MLPRESYLQHGGTFVDRLRTRIVQREVLSRLPAARLLRVLDLGCGYHAGFLKAMEDRLSEGVGVDFAVGEPNTPPLRFVRSSIEEALPTMTEQAVLFISALEHITDAAPCLAHCHRVLKPGGRLLVNVPTWYAKPVLEFSAFRLATSPACEMDDHKMYYSKRDLWPLLVRSGFKPSHIRLQYSKCGMILFGTAIR